ncbi:MAG: PfkB family carbohydrate kinase [Actinomycetota bacterium]|nr:PfkB family carbohydrate kinase [Actinomycetota bacterium]
MKAAVVGHVEVVQFMRVPSMPRPGDIVHAVDFWELPAGGGPGAAVQLRKLAGNCTLFTALGDDEFGHAAFDDLSALGLKVEAVFQPEATRRAVTHVDDTGERTITVLGARLAPSGDDDLPWNELDEAGAVYFTAGDVSALRLARHAGILVATARVLNVLAAAKVELDALVGSALDPAETYRDGDIEPPPRLVVQTSGDTGGAFQVRGGPREEFAAPALDDGRIVDRYGAGDSFAGGLTYALGAEYTTEEAISFAARCGAAALYGRGPYEGQLSNLRE